MRQEKQHRSVPLFALPVGERGKERGVNGGAPVLLRKLLHAAAGVPILLALVVAVPHCVCCVVQSSCGGGTALESDAAHPARDALRDLAKESGEGMPLVGGS